MNAATHATTPETALPLLEEAITRLRESISFDRGDVVPCVALGEAFVTKSEWIGKMGKAQEASACLQAALDEGYVGGALRIQSKQTGILLLFL